MISASPANVGARVADVFVLVREMLEGGHLLCVSDSGFQMVMAGFGSRIRRAEGRIRIKRCERCTIGEGKATAGNWIRNEG